MSGVDSVGKATPLRVAVVGGSLGGLFAALALRRAGHDVDVYERNKGALEARGAGLRMQADLAERLRAVGMPVDADVLSPGLFRFIGIDDAIVHEAQTDIVYTSWKRLYEALLLAVGASHYHLGAHATHIEPQAAGATVCLEDGRRVGADLVVAADGLASGVRQRLAPNETLRYAGYVCWRGVVAQERLSAKTRLLLDGAGNYVMPERSHMSIYPIPAMAGCVPDYSVVWYRPVPTADLAGLLVDRRGRQREWSVPAGELSPATVALLHEAARRELPPAPAEVVLKMPEPFIQVIVDVETERMVHGRICLLGDAAFGGRPHLGAGTAKAAGDAWTLAAALDGRPPEAVDAALAGWQRERLALGVRYIRANRELGAALIEGRVSPEQFTSRSSWEGLLRATDGA